MLAQTPHPSNKAQLVISHLLSNGRVPNLPKEKDSHQLTESTYRFRHQRTLASEGFLPHANVHRFRPPKRAAPVVVPKKWEGGVTLPTPHHPKGGLPPGRHGFFGSLSLIAKCRNDIYA